MIEKGPGWSHSLHLIELFPDLTNFLKPILQNWRKTMKLNRSLFNGVIVIQVHLITREG
jgi:hypothetical protein